MPYTKGDLVDGRFFVTGICSEAGGMGKVLYVEDQLKEFSGTLVLKYCSELDSEHIKRFSREVRLMESFKGNSRVVDIFFSNTDSEPPYFVMKNYEQGDLTNYIGTLGNDPANQEVVFTQMIDCIAELHAVATYHRDIKPQNFLIEGQGLSLIHI